MTPMAMMGSRASNNNATLGKGRRTCELALIVALMLQPATRGSRTLRLAVSLVSYRLTLDAFCKKIRCD